MRSTASRPGLRADRVPPRGSSRARRSPRSSMRRAGVPTAGQRHLRGRRRGAGPSTRGERPPVVKADWLAAGKGVVVPETREEAEAAHPRPVRRGAGRARSARPRGAADRPRGDRPSRSSAASTSCRWPRPCDHKRLRRRRRPARTPAAWAPTRRFRGSAGASWRRRRRRIFEPIAWRMARDGTPVPRRALRRADADR